LSFQVTVNDFPIMNVLKSETNLGKPLEHLLLTERLASLLLHLILEITAYDTQFISKLNSFSFRVVKGNLHSLKWL
jgi:hypothetical protein